MSNSCMCNSVTDLCINYTSRCFGKIWLFNNFNNQQYSILKSIGKQKVIPKGSVVFSQGDSANKIFLVKGGRIKLTKYFSDGRELTLDFRKCGELFGEDILGSTNRYPVSAWAMEDTVTCGVSKKDIEKIVLKNPDIGLAIIKNMSNRISSLSNRLENMAIINIQDRLYRVLMNIAHEHGIKETMGYLLDFILTHEDLGFLVNAHRVSITKSMNNLISSGKIILRNKTIFIPFDTPQSNS